MFVVNFKYKKNIFVIFGVFTVMLRKQDIKILTELLDLKDVKVISHRLHDGIGMILQTESTKSYSTCPRCGIKSHR